MIVDFHNSFLEWETPDNSLGRFKAEAIIFYDHQSFILGSEVIACKVYNTNDFFISPAYKFQPLFSKETQIIFRSFAETQMPNDTISHLLPEFKNVVCKIEELKSYTVIEDYDTLEKEFSKNKNLQVNIKSEKYELQFPVKHININGKQNRFQIETGTLVIPNETNKLIRAFSTFSSFDYVEFISEEQSGLKRFFNSVSKLKAKIQIIASS